MAIKVKAVERNVSFEKNSEKWAYVLQTDLYNRLSDAKVIQEAALRSVCHLCLLPRCHCAA